MTRDIMAGVITSGIVIAATAGMVYGIYQAGFDAGTRKCELERASASNAAKQTIIDQTEAEYALFERASGDYHARDNKQAVAFTAVRRSLRVALAADPDSAGCVLTDAELREWRAAAAGIDSAPLSAGDSPAVPGNTAASGDASDQTGAEPGLSGGSAGISQMPEPVSAADRRNGEGGQ